MTMLQTNRPSEAAFVLPVDIILHIFVVGTFDSSDLEDRTASPLLVSQVNRSWRALALQATPLWKTIVYKGHPKFILIPPSRNKIKPSEYYPLINLFLERSSTRPLTIHLDLRHYDHDYAIREADTTGSGHPIDPLLRLLTPHGSRFQHFTFISNTWIDVVQVLRYHIYNLQMPLLESFELTRAYLSQTFSTLFEPRPLLKRVPFCVKPNGGAEHAETFGTVTQSRWPDVKRVSLNGIPLKWRLWCFTNLTSLAINYLAEEARPSLLDLRNILRSNAHCLTYLQIHGANPVQSEELIHDQIELPELRELSLGYAQCQHAIWFIRSVYTPSLTSLEICDVWKCYSQFCEHTEKQTFSAIRNHPRDASELCAQILEHMPFPLEKIKHLTLQYISLWTDDQHVLIDAITAADDASGADDACLPSAGRLLMSFPALDTLSLECTDFEPLAFHLFRNQRRPPKYPLPKLQLYSCDPWRRGYTNSFSGTLSRVSHHGDIEVDQMDQNDAMDTSL